MKISDNIIQKFNTRSFSMLASFILIISGIYMCFKDLSAKGTIDLKTIFIEGEIETGSLGLMAMFLGVIVILILNIKKEPYKGEEVNININGMIISGKGLSYRKMKELIYIANSENNKIQT